MARAARRVFLSHTEELRRFPTGDPFVQAAERAVARAGDAVVDMAYFTARDERPASYCRTVLRQADVYVGLLGFRYGTPVQDQPHLSYVELEHEAALEAGLPRLVFHLGEEPAVPLPAAVFVDPAHADRQRRFRERTRQATTATFDSPAQLETLLFQALVELGRDAPVGEDPWGWELRRTPRLALEFWQGTAQCPMTQDGDLIRVRMRSGPFELRFPPLRRGRALAVCAWDGDELLATVDGVLGGVPEQFGPGTGFADTEYSSSTLFLSLDGHMHFADERVERWTRRHDRLTVGATWRVGGDRTPLREQREPLYLLVVRYDDGVLDPASLEQFVLVFG